MWKLNEEERKDKLVLVFPTPSTRLQGKFSQLLYYAHYHYVSMHYVHMDDEALYVGRHSVCLFGSWGVCSCVCGRKIYTEP